MGLSIDAKYLILMVVCGCLREIRIYTNEICKTREKFNFLRKGKMVISVKKSENFLDLG